MRHQGENAKWLLNHWHGPEHDHIFFTDVNAKNAWKLRKWQGRAAEMLLNEHQHTLNEMTSEQHPTHAATTGEHYAEHLAHASRLDELSRQHLETSQRKLRSFNQEYDELQAKKHDEREQWRQQRQPLGGGAQGGGDSGSESSSGSGPREVRDE